MGSLNAALATKTKAYEDDRITAANKLNLMAGMYKDMATTALGEYDRAYTAFKDETDRLQKIQDNLDARAEQIKIIQMNHDNDVKLAQLNAKLDPTKVAAAEAAGLEFTDGGYKPKVPVQVPSNSKIGTGVVTAYGSSEW
jgi:hypothetical protein